MQPTATVNAETLREMSSEAKRRKDEERQARQKALLEVKQAKFRDLIQKVREKLVQVAAQGETETYLYGIMIFTAGEDYPYTDAFEESQLNAESKEFLAYLRSLELKVQCIDRSSETDTATTYCPLSRWQDILVSW